MGFCFCFVFSFKNFCAGLFSRLKYHLRRKTGRAFDKPAFFLINYKFLTSGRIAQLGERSPYKAEVTGSIPVPPTIVIRGGSSVG